MDIPTTTTTEPQVIGVSQTVLQNLHDTATALTAERKRKGKTVPENLTTQEQIKAFTVTASHAVSYCYRIGKSNE